MAGRPLRRARMNAALAHSNGKEIPRGKGWKAVNEFDEGDNIDIMLSEVPYTMRKDIASKEDETLLIAWAEDKGFSVIIANDEAVSMDTVAKGIAKLREAEAVALELLESSR